MDSLVSLSTVRAWLFSTTPDELSRRMLAARRYRTNALSDLDEVHLWEELICYHTEDMWGTPSAHWANLMPLFGQVLGDRVVEIEIFAGMIIFGMFRYTFRAGPQRKLSGRRRLARGRETWQAEVSSTDVSPAGVAAPRGSPPGYRGRVVSPTHERKIEPTTASQSSRPWDTVAATASFYGADTHAQLRNVLIVGIRGFFFRLVMLMGALWLVTTETVRKAYHWEHFVGLFIVFIVVFVAGAGSQRGTSGRRRLLRGRKAWTAMDDSPHRIPAKRRAGQRREVAPRTPLPGSASSTAEKHRGDSSEVVHDFRPGNAAPAKTSPSAWFPRSSSDLGSSSFSPAKTAPKALAVVTATSACGEVPEAGTNRVLFADGAGERELSPPLYSDPLLHRPMAAGADGGTAGQPLQRPPGLEAGSNLCVDATSTIKAEMDELQKIRKAGLHIYRFMMSTGVRSVSNWLRLFAHRDLRAGPRAGFLWETAWCLDYELGIFDSAQPKDGLLNASLTAEISLRRLAAAELQARQKISPAAARVMASGKLKPSIVPYWMEREARRAAKAERSLLQLGRRLQRTIMGPFWPPDVDATLDADESEVSGGHAVAAGKLCESIQRRRDDGKRWVPKLRETEGFPLPEELQALCDGGQRNLFPIPLIPRPTTRPSRSHRVRKRFQVRMEAWRDANRYLTSLNALRGGAPAKQTRCRVRMRTILREPTPAQSQAHKVALREARRLALARSELTPCVQPIASLLRTVHTDSYSSTQPVQMRVTLDAEAIDEPNHEKVVELLDVLSSEEAEYYRHESNVVDLSLTSSVLFKEIESHYAFVAGATSEYAKYFLREDLPSRMWHFTLQDEVKALAGFAVVPKKRANRQQMPGQMPVTAQIMGSSEAGR